MVAWTPGVVVVVWLVVVRVGARLAIYAFLNVHAGRNVVVIVVMLNDPGWFLANNFPTFKIRAFAVARTVKVCSEGRRDEQERQSSKSNAFHGDEILGYPAPDNVGISTKVASAKQN